MNKLNFSLTVITLVFSLNAKAQTQADEADLQKFSESNYCQGCDISNATISGNHDNGSLINSFAIKTVFTSSLKKMNFSGSIMTYCKFSSINKISSQEANFDKVNLSYAEINNTDLSGANFTDINLGKADFYNVNLSDVDFTNAVLNDVTFNKSVLIGANLTDEQLKQVKSIKCTILPNGELNSNGC